MRLCLIFIIAISTLQLIACDIVRSSHYDTESEKNLYFLGTKFGSGLAALNLSESELKIVSQGVIDAAKGKLQAGFDADGRAEKTQAFWDTRSQNQTEENESDGRAVIDEYLKKGYQKTATGLLYKIEVEGKGNAPGQHDIVNINYTGKLSNGKIFASNIDDKAPARYPLDKIIPGWAEGIRMIKPGGKIQLIIPSEIGYGKQGYAPKIPGGATLLMDVELISMIDSGEVTKATSKSSETKVK